MRWKLSVLKLAGWGFVLVLVVSVMAGPSWAQARGYRLPWQYCLLQKVLQGWGESPSHNTTQMWYAYDFRLSEGAPVRAAKAGTVAFVQSGQTVCGGYEYRNNANYVTIYHGDGTATLYLHLRDVYVSVGQSVLRGQTVGTAGRTGWTYCTPHLHFQRQGRGGWITNSQAVYFDEYPGQQLQRGSWYQSQNYWPGDFCPTRVEGSWGYWGAVGIAVGRRRRRRRKGHRLLVGMLGLGLVVALISGCGGGPAQSEGGRATPAVPLGPERLVAVGGSSPTPTFAEPPPPPTPEPAPTPRPVTLPSVQEVQQLTEAWVVFESPEWRIRFKHPVNYQVQVQEGSGWITFSINRPVAGSISETFVSLFLWKYQGPPVVTAEDLLQWVSLLPPEKDPVGGKVFITGELHLPQIGKGWVIRWEPLPGNSEVVVDSVVLPAGERILWVNLSNLVAGDWQSEDALWSRKMAFLATLEVTR